MILPSDNKVVEQSNYQDEPPTYSDSVASTNSSNWNRGTKGQSSSPLDERWNAIPSTSVSFRGTTFSSAAAWFSFGALSTTDKEVKATVLGLIRDVVKQTPGPAGVAIFQSCAEACKARHIQFDAILQERSIEGHTPLYWAIIKHKSSDQLGLLDLLLSFPLSADTRADASLACMLQSDNELFQRLQSSLGWRATARTGADEILLGSSPDDSVTIQNVEGDNGAFKAEFYMPEFQQRLRVSRTVQIEFIARERLWALTFSRDHLTGARRRSKRNHMMEPSSAGYVGITILDQSLPTPFSGRITVENLKNPSKPPLVVNLKPMEDLKPGKWGMRGVCSVDLCTISDGPSLQHTGSSYIDERNGLRVKLEAKLVRDDPECVIM